MKLDKTGFVRIDTTKRISQRELESPISAHTDPFPYTFTPDQTVEDVLHTLQSRKTEQEVEVLYVTDTDNVLKGALHLSDLLFNPGNTLLIDLLDPDVAKVQESDLLEKGLKVLTQNQTLMVPVVNQEERFVGVLEILPHSTSSPPKKSPHYRHLKEDIFQFIGFSIEQRKHSSPWHEYRLRMPWLLCNLVGGLVCAVISEFLQAPLVEVVLLAFFIPLVLGLSESVGIQSMTLSLRFLHIRKVNWVQVWRRLIVEGKSSFLLGLTSALLISFFYFAWSIELQPILAIGISVIVAMMSAALFGGLFPILLHALHLDPKVAAGPVVLMMADVITITIYLGLSTFMLV